MSLLLEVLRSYQLNVRIFVHNVHMCFGFGFPSLFSFIAGVLDDNAP